MTTTDAGGQLTGSELTTAENRLVNAAATGGIADLRVGGPEDDPANGASWDAERTIRAGLLAELLTGQRTPEGRRQQPVRLRGPSSPEHWCWRPPTWGAHCCWPTVISTHRSTSDRQARETRRPRPPEDPRHHPDWPWAGAFLTCWKQLCALPVPT